MTDTAAPVLVMEGVEHSFLSLRVLKAINLAIGAGEVVGFVGANGAGKTTTLRIAATLLRPTHGQVRIGGHDALGNSLEARGALGFMPELFGVYDDMTVREYLEFFADAYELSRADAGPRIDGWIANAGLEEHRNVGQLSKGSKQRLFFARTFLHDPRLLLLDEPFSGMDPPAVAWTIDVIRREAGGGRAFLIASHDLAELERVATRIVALREGRIMAPGEAARVVYLIRTEGDPQHARDVLRSALPDGEVRATATAGTWEVVLAAAPESDAGLLRRLIAAHVPVCGFERQRIAIGAIYGRANA